MAKYSFQIYPKGDIDYRYRADVPNLKKFLKQAASNGLEVAAADSHTRHDMEQLYMDSAYEDESFAKLYGRSIFTSDSQRKNVKNGKLRPLRQLISGANGNSNG